MHNRANIGEFIVSEVIVILF